MNQSPPQPPGKKENPQLEKSTGGASPSVLDITVQSCTVELFHAIGVALAPLPRVTGPTHIEFFDLAGVVPFSAPKTNGTLTLSMNDPVYGLLVPPVSGNSARTDALRELTNQLIGRIKNRLMQFQVTLRVGLPSVMRKELLRKRQSSGQIKYYQFRTLRGEVVVALEGSIHDEPLTYSGGVRVAKEGDLIVF